jgi:hypothetical protein
MTEKEYRKQINDLQKERKDILVVVDTLQQVLGRAKAALQDNKEMYDYVFTTSANWSLNWKPQINNDENRNP